MALANLGNLTEEELNKIENIVHPQWQVNDPVPDIHALFQRFNAEFFENKLVNVELEWSKSLLEYAGACYHCSTIQGETSCIIRLSENVLKECTRKEMIEALLHEMIYAYYVVKGITESDPHHSRYFARKMMIINRRTGTNITENRIKRPLNQNGATERPEVIIPTVQIKTEFPQLLIVKEEPVLHNTSRQEIVQEYQENFIRQVKMEPIVKQEPPEACICPICNKRLAVDRINHHLDECLSLEFIREQY